MIVLGRQAAGHKAAGPGSFSLARWSGLAFLRPAATSSVTRLLRTATSENSAATKKPLAATRARTARTPNKFNTVPSGLGTSGMGAVSSNMLHSINLRGALTASQRGRLSTGCRSPSMLQ